jgi:hypothetical protein
VLKIKLEGSMSLCFRVRPLIALLLLGLGACAIERSELSLASPPSATAAPASAKVAIIRSVKDDRRFEQAPTDPSIPSIGFEGTAQATAETKARAIGRKRNTYGMALGDVLLQPGQDVAGTVRAHLAAALRESGYVVLDGSGSAPGAIALDVTIRRFWAWFTPGFATVTVSTVVTTDVSIDGGGRTVTINALNERSSLAATDAVWKDSIEKALEAYRRDARAKFRSN